MIPYSFCITFSYTVVSKTSTRILSVTVMRQYIIVNFLSLDNESAPKRWSQGTLSKRTDLNAPHIDPGSVQDQAGYPPQSKLTEWLWSVDSRKKRVNAQCLTSHLAGYTFFLWLSSWVFLQGKKFRRQTQSTYFNLLIMGYLNKDTVFSGFFWL